MMSAAVFSSYIICFGPFSLEILLYPAHRPNRLLATYHPWVLEITQFHVYVSTHKNILYYTTSEHWLTYTLVHITWIQPLGILSWTGKGKVHNVIRYIDSMIRTKSIEKRGRRDELRQTSFVSCFSEHAGHLLVSEEASGGQRAVTVFPDSLIVRNSARVAWKVVMPYPKFEETHIVTFLPYFLYSLDKNEKVVP